MKLDAPAVLVYGDQSKVLLLVEIVKVSKYDEPTLFTRITFNCTNDENANIMDWPLPAVAVQPV